MSTSYKAQAIANELADKLKSRGLSSLGVVQSFDTDSNPLITIGTGVAGTANAVIKVMPQDWPLAQDVLGNAANAFSPHQIKLATEADYAGTTDNVADADSKAILGPLLTQIIEMGTQWKWYESASGTAPTAATLNSESNLKSANDPDHYRPLLSSQ